MERLLRVAPIPSLDLYTQIGLLFFVPILPSADLLLWPALLSPEAMRRVASAPVSIARALAEVANRAPEDILSAMNALEMMKRV